MRHYHSTITDSRVCLKGPMEADTLSLSGATRVIRASPYLTSRLLRLHDAAHHLAETVPDILQHAEVARTIDEELVRALVQCLAESAAFKADRFHRYQSAVMKRFEEFLEANEDRPLHMTEICGSIGVSGKTLRLHCLERLGISPLTIIFSYAECTSFAVNSG